MEADADLVIKLRFMNGPFKGSLVTSSIDSNNILPLDVINVEGYDYWIKDETLADGSFKCWWLNNEQMERIEKGGKS
jgi:hypothetical protein